MLGAAIIISLAYINFGGLLNSPIDGGDDTETYSEVIERGSLKNIFDFHYKTERGGPSTYFTPVMWFLWREIIIHKDVGFTYRITGLIIHLFNILLVFLVMRLLSLRSYAAYLAALWFGFSSFSLATIGWISGALTQGFSLFFLLLSFCLFLFFAQYKKWLLYFFSLAVFLVGTFAKETVALHCWIFAVYLFFLPPVWIKTLKEKIFLALPYFILAMPVLAIAKLRIAQSALSKNWGGINLSDHLFYRIFDYLSLLLRPGIIDGVIKFAIISLILILLPLLWHFLKKEKLNIFILCWLFLSLGVFSLSNFRDISSLSRYLYWTQIPLAGLILFNASNIISGMKKWSKKES